ncbi:MAG: hypothetical protein ACKVWR_14995 [Acidimicrobiales bacterium]
MRPPRLLAALAAAALAAGPLGPAAAAEGEVAGFEVTGAGQQARVELWRAGRRDVAHHVPAGQRRQGAVCAYSERAAGDAAFDQLVPERPDGEGYRFWAGYCSNAPDTLRMGWYRPAEALDLDGAARRLAELSAERLVREGGPGGLSIAMSPPTFALVGRPARFWVQGWDGRPVVVAAELAGVELQATIELREVRWRFPDGEARRAASLGDAEGDAARMVFTRRGEGDGAAAEVSAVVELAVSYVVNGGERYELAPLEAPLSRVVEVREAQAVVR